MIETQLTVTSVGCTPSHNATVSSKSDWRSPPLLLLDVIYCIKSAGYVQRVKYRGLLGILSWTMIKWYVCTVAENRGKYLVRDYRRQFQCWRLSRTTGSTARWYKKIIKVYTFLASWPTDLPLWAKRKTHIKTSNWKPDGMNTNKTVIFVKQTGYT